eukprot:SAG11_NODE_1548_length_4703_cov_6.701564_5_plen_242_part_00
MEPEPSPQESEEAVSSGDDYVEAYDDQVRPAPLSDGEREPEQRSPSPRGAGSSSHNSNGQPHDDSSTQAMLLEAVQRGDVHEAKALLVSGADPNRPRTESGMELAHLAAMAGDSAMLAALCAAGANVNQSDGEPMVLKCAIQTYLYDQDAAMAMARVLCVRSDDGITADVGRGTLFAPGFQIPATVTSRDALGQALDFAAGNGWLPMVALLLDAGADPNYFRPEDDYVLTPLIWRLETRRE